MAQSPPLQSFPGLDHWGFSQGWGRAGHSDSSSPASSSDSSASWPCDGVRRPSRPVVPARSARAAQPTPPAPRRARPAPLAGQRQSASEREKLRMRTLARALLELRRFLPPSVAPAGQSLTKIETLRLAIRYIGHLSSVLGLGEDGLRRRRRRHRDAESPPGWSLCPDGGPLHEPTLTPGLTSVAYSGPSWASPTPGPGPRVPTQNLGNRVSDPNPWVTPPYFSQIQSPLHQSLGIVPDTSLWTPPQACPGTQTSPEPGSKAGRWTPPSAPAELVEMHQSLSVSPESCVSLGSPSLLSHPCCQRLQPQPQWECWGNSVEVLPNAEDQDPSPTFPLCETGPIPSSGLRLSSSSSGGLWQEDLEGPPLNIFY